MRKVISLVLVLLMMVSLFVPMLSVNAETNEEIVASEETSEDVMIDEPVMEQDDLEKIAKIIVRKH